MPEQPPAKRAVSASVVEHVRHAIAPRARAPAVRYAELHCRTNFSFLEGASHPDELAARAAELGDAALAITDRHSLAGVVRAHVAAKAANIKLLIGAEITPTDAPPIVLWATDRAAYGRLARLITLGCSRVAKGECLLTREDIALHAEGLLAGVVLTQQTRSDGDAETRRHGEETSVSASPCLPLSASSHHLATYRDIFSDRCYALAELHRGPDDRGLLRKWVRLSEQTGVPLVAANDVHYHIRERQRLQDVLTAIRCGCPVEQLGDRRFPNAERHLKPPAAMAALFADCPDAVTRTIEIADRCHFTLDELKYEYPEELCPAGMTPIEHLTRLTWDGAHRRYPRGVPDRVRGLIEHELRLIDELSYAAYFLTVWDLVRFARGRGILCQGRGSAANSVVCFCLEVTSVDPEQIDVLFERFVSKERDEAPDIDVDFEHERREEVLQYLFGKYGRERAGMTAEVISYRPRSAIRDVGKALGLSLDRVNSLAKHVDHHHDREQLAKRLAEAGLPINSPSPPEGERGTGGEGRMSPGLVEMHASGSLAPHPQPLSPFGGEGSSLLARHLVELVTEILDFPRHLSQHVGGMVMTRGPLCELVPIENAAMPGRTVVQWDKDDLDALGILKVDCLALGMLTAIRKCFALVERHHDRRLTLANIPQNDRRVYDMVCRADTMGVFQIESRAQMAMLPRLRPRCFYDLVIEVAIVRPGPIQGDMVHPYLRRRCGEEPVEYPDERIREVLSKTLGVPIFQEQAMRLAIVAAGFTPGEADQLRRAMGAWRRRGVIDQFQQKLMAGMHANGYSTDFADRLFRQIRGFGEYGFPESHAASFALLVYVSAWLKHHYPAAFTAALLNSQPMGFYAAAQLVADARKHGVTVLPADVNLSEWDCTLALADAETRRHGDAERSNLSPRLPLSASPRLRALRLGLRMIAGLSQAHARRIVERRGARPFASVDEFARRTGLSSSVLTRLSQADAFQSLHLNRRESLWQSLPDHSPMPLFDADISADDSFDDEPAVPLPELSPVEEVVADYRTIGLSLRDHPVKFLRPQLNELRVVPAAKLAALPHGRRVRVAGLVLMRQRPSTASGVTFVTLEDETGMANLIVYPAVWERYRRAARSATLMQVDGVLQRQGEIIHVLVSRLSDLSQQLTAVQTRSRDFR